MTKKTKEPEKEKKDTPKFYSHLTMEQKRNLRAKLEKVVEHKKRQLEIFEKNFIKPIKEQIKLAEQVKKNEIPIQVYIQRNERWSKWLLEFMSHVGQGVKDEKGKSKKSN